MSRIRYILDPGYITSKTYGDRHHIGVAQLVELHGVNINDCVILPGHDKPEYRAAIRRCYAGLPILRPLASGNYEKLAAAIKDGMT